MLKNIVTRHLNILVSVSKKDKKWREIAFNITKCRSRADDLVQDMYLRINKYNVTKWNYSYIILIMWNLFKDDRRLSNKTTELKEYQEEVTKDHNYSYNDRDLDVLKEIAKLSNEDRKLLELNYDLSIGEISKNLEVCRISTHRKLDKIRVTVLKKNYKHEYRNRRLKNKGI